jgi:hypothetical protein
MLMERRQRHRIGPPRVCDERRELAISVDDVALLGGATRFLDAAIRQNEPSSPCRACEATAISSTIFFIADRVSGSR